MMDGCIAHKEGDVEFYLPWLFKYNKFYKQSANLQKEDVHAIPLLVRDLVYFMPKSKHICSIYYNAHIQHFFWKNHPLHYICAAGDVVGCSWKWIGGIDHLIFQLDDSSGGVSNLKCKCTKDTVCEGIQVPDILGHKIIVYGYPNINYGEFDVIKIVALKGLADEIVHWRKATEMRSQLATPWQVDSTLMATSSGFQYDEDAPTVPRTPNIFKRTLNEDYIEQLQIDNLKDELVIASPYDDSEYTDEEEGKIPYWYEGTISQKQKSSFVSLVKPPIQELSDIDASASSLKNAKTRFLSVLIHDCNDETLTTVGRLYQKPKVDEIIHAIALNKFPTQNIRAVKSFEDVKTDILNGLLGKLIHSGLLEKTADKIYMQNLQRLYDYCEQRLLVLIKLQCCAGTIDQNHVRRKLQLPQLSNIAVIDVFKEALKHIMAMHPQLIKSWWIDMNLDRASVIHLRFYDTHSLKK